jgi:hypothetical protein
MCIFHQTFDNGVNMDMFIYISMSSTQIHVHYLILHNDFFK